MTRLRALLLVAIVACAGEDGMAPSSAECTPSDPTSSWKLYTNARFGFSVRYPSDWRLGEPLPDGSGILLTPPIPKSRVGLTGFLNLAEGKSQDGRQTLDEFVSAHHRIMEEYYGKKHIKLKWQEDHRVTLGGVPAKQLSFSYRDEINTEMIELHIFSLGRNEGRGIRMKFPASHRTTLMPVLAEMLKTYQPGRDQDAVSPFQPKASDKLQEQARYRLVRAFVFYGREVFHGFPGGGTGLRGGIERSAWVDVLPHGGHSLAVPDGLLEMRHSGLAVRVGGRQRLQDRLSMFRHFSTVIQNSLGVSHSPMHDHVLGVPEHGVPMFLHLFLRCTVRNRHQSSVRKDKSKRKQRGFH